MKNKDLAGKDAIFDVTILSASKRTLPEITDEFAEKVRPGLTADLLREELRKAVDSQDAQEYMGVRNEALGRAVAEVMDADVPDTLVTNQGKRRVALSRATSKIIVWLSFGPLTKPRTLSKSPEQRGFESEVY